MCEGSSKMGRNSQILILRYSQNKAHKLQLLQPLNGIFGTNWPISMGFVVKDSFTNNVLYNQSEKLKLNSTNLRLILLDRITYFVEEIDADSADSLWWTVTCK